MAKYYLVENKQQIHLGPIDWRYRFIQSELDDLNVSYTVSPTESGYVKIDDKFEIIPQGSSIVPEYDPVFEELVGPTITYTDNEAHETYTKKNRDVNSAKAAMYSIIANERYTHECKGVEYTLGSDTVTLPTDREGRKQFTDLLQSIGDTSIIFKFRGKFYNLNKTDLTNIVNHINTYVQAQYTWEHDTYNSIERATTLDELKAISTQK